MIRNCLAELVLWKKDSKSRVVRYIKEAVVPKVRR
jgi:hypothetical protein